MLSPRVSAGSILVFASASLKLLFLFLKFFPFLVFLCLEEDINQILAHFDLFLPFLVLILDPFSFVAIYVVRLLQVQSLLKS